MGELKELAVELYGIGALKFGDFITKVGLKTPVYFDLRVIISHPRILRKLSTILWEYSNKSRKVDQICGVPYTALPIATLISAATDIPMLIRRKEAKSYGTKKLIEGVFESGESCVIIEDVVTSGSSILETVKDLRNEGLIVTEAYVIVDREQGGRKNLEKNGIEMKSLYTLTQLMEYLLEAKKVTSEIVTEVADYLKEYNASVKPIEKDEKINRLDLDFSSRAKLAKHPMAKKLFQLMDLKETTICLAADFTRSDDILELADLAGPHIAVLKTHVDIIEDYDENFINGLKQLATRHKFLLMEDRKFADIGNTVSLQYSRGIYKISEWADIITAHTIAGHGILNAFENALRGNSENRGIFLITEMSSKGALTTANYVKESIMIGNQSDLVIGHVCQSNVFSDPSLIQLTPGVKLARASDDLGQQYNTPESVVNSGADLAVVGRGITEATDKLRMILEYKTQLWSAYKNRLNRCDSRKLSTILWEYSNKSRKVDQICGVPYTALPIATLISAATDIPMLIRRKEAKSYGTKKLIEGVFESGESCVIIEDVVTSGSSILETVKDLRNEGLIVTEAYVIVDREQEGRKNLEKNGIEMKSLYTLTQLMEYLLEAKKVTSEIVTEVADYLKEYNASVKPIEKDEKINRLDLDFKRYISNE